MAWLDRRIAPGDVVKAGDLMREAMAAGHRRYTLTRARWALGITTEKGRGVVNPPRYWTRTSSARP